MKNVDIDEKRERKMNKIVFVIGGMARGGAERVISILANHYAQNGWNVDIVMMLSNRIEYQLDESIRLIDMTQNTKNRILGAPYWILSFRKYIRENNPEIIVSFIARINIIVLIAVLGMKKKVIISERNDPSMDGRSKVIDILTEIIYRKANKIVFQTKRASKHFSNRLQKSGIIISNPISINTIANEKPSHKIVSVGRLAKQKNQKILIEAFSLIVNKYPDYQLWIYGEGDLRKELQKEISALNLEKNVFLLGNVSDIHNKISDAKMFVLSSDYEGLSNALLEAMMMGLPCISTNCAGSDEYIINMKNGLLVPIGDKNELYKAMVKLIEDESLRQNIAKMGKRSVQICSSRIVMKQWCDVIENS